MNKQERRVKDFMYGILAGLCSNYLTDSIFALADSYQITIPPAVLWIQIIVSLVGIFWLLMKVTRFE